MSSRHLSRSIAMQSLFEWDFYGRAGNLKEIAQRNLQEMGSGLKDKTFVFHLVEGVEKYLLPIDEVMIKAAPQWPLEQVSLVDRNVLRLGLYELIYTNKKSVPPKVAINEAIELAKNFGGPASGKFVNGVLGAVFKQMPQESESEKKAWVGALVYRQENNQFQWLFFQENSGNWRFFTSEIGREETLTQAVKRMLEGLGLETIRIMKELGERDYPEKGGRITDFVVEAMMPAMLKDDKKTKWFKTDQLNSLNQKKSDKRTVGQAISYLESK